jgi:hypothetical protein
VGEESGEVNKGLEEGAIAEETKTETPTTPKHAEDDKELGINKNSKPYYSMTGLELGQFREADKIESDLPQMFNRKFCTIWSLLRAPTQVVKAELRYVPCCEGCLRCKVKPPPETRQSILARIFSVFRPAPIKGRFGMGMKVKGEAKFSIDRLFIPII